MKQGKDLNLKNRLSKQWISNLMAGFKPARNSLFNPSKTSLLAVALISGAFGTYVLFFSKAAPPPAEAPFDNVLSNPIDPLQQLAIGFGGNSHWLQAWRGYMDTRPATVLRDSAGFNTNDNRYEQQYRMISENGFKRARIELGWGLINYQTGQLEDDQRESLRAKLQAIKKYGIRPLILLNSNDSNPTPTIKFTGKIMQDAKKSDPAKCGPAQRADWVRNGCTMTIKVDPATRAQIKPKYSGLATPRPCNQLKKPTDGGKPCAASIDGVELPDRCKINNEANQQLNRGLPADPLIMSVSADGTATLSRPLFYEIKADCPWTMRTHKYQPFHPRVSPSPQLDGFEETVNGWVDYSGVIVKEVKQGLGTDDFDVEVWNELSFGSAFLFGRGYYGMTKDEWTGSPFGEILKRTINHVRNPAVGGPNVKVGDGFANQTPFRNGAGIPGLSALDKHYYTGGPRDFPQLDENGKPETAGTPLDALGQINGIKKPDGGLKDVFIPAYSSTQPEFWLSGFNTEHMVRDLSPYTTEVSGGQLHGRNVSACNPRGLNMLPPGCNRLTVWMTETATLFNFTASNRNEEKKLEADPSYKRKYYPVPESEANPPDHPKDPTDPKELASDEAVYKSKMHFRARAVLRHLTAHVNKGVSAIHYYHGNPEAGGYDHTSAQLSHFYAWCKKDAACKKEPLTAPYPCDDKWKDNDGIAWRAKVLECDDRNITVMSSVKRLMNSLNGAENINNPRQLELLEIRDNHNHKQWEGDGTPGRPPLYNREVVAVLPFQVTGKKFVIPTYVMTRDLLKIYHPDKAVGDPTRYDMPAESYRIKLGNLVPAGAKVTATDPLTGASVPVRIVSSEGDEMVIQIDLTDSVRLITIEETGNYILPPANALPTVEAVIPPRGKKYTAPADVQIEAIATDSDGAITKVEAYRGLIKLGEDTTPPYEFMWRSVPEGTFGILFKAYDDKGAFTINPIVHKVTVHSGSGTEPPPDSTLPNTSITSKPASSTADKDATFIFTSNEDEVTFECDLDDNGFEPCISPWTYANLRLGAHTFSVRAIDAVGHTDASPATYSWTIGDTDITPPNTTIDSKPANPSASSSASFSFSSDEENVTFECKLDNGVYGTCLSPKNYSGLGVGSHTFSVRAVDAADNADSTPATYTWNIASNDSTLPSTPAGLTATSLDANRVRLNWSASTDPAPNPSGIAKYNILRNNVVVGTVTPTQAGCSGNDTSCTFNDSNLNANTTYTYKVQAVDGSGLISADSNTVTVKTSNTSTPDTEDPTMPANLVATAASPSQVNLTWSASTDTGGSGLRGYNIYRNGIKLNASPITTTSFGDSTVDPNTTYTYSVEAVDGAGNTSAKAPDKNIKTPKVTRGDITSNNGRPDGKIDFQDLLYVLLRYQRGENDPKADVTNGTNNSSKNKVDFQDLVYLLVRFEK